MATRTADGLRVGLRTIVAAVVTVAAALTIASPASAAKKPPPEPEALVSQFLAEIEGAADDVDLVAEKVMIDVAKRLDRAVDRVSLREVLKVDQTSERTITREQKAFEKFATKGQTKLLRELDKLTSNPEHALTVRTAAAEALARVQTVNNTLRTQVADMVNEAIDDIQGALDEELAEDVGVGG